MLVVGNYDGFRVLGFITFWSGMTREAVRFGVSRAVDPPSFAASSRPAHALARNRAVLPRLCFFFPVGRRPSLVVFSPRL